MRQKLLPPIHNAGPQARPNLAVRPIGLGCTTHYRTFWSQSTLGRQTWHGTESAIADPMAREVIPWHVFLEALHKQPEAELGKWLARWRYTNEGAILKFKPVKAEDNLRRATKQYHKQ